jgi:two-component system, response regulator
MKYKDVDILLVEDNPHDVELTLRALKKHNLANQVHVARDGQEALDFLFGTGPDSEIKCNRLKVILLDLKLPKMSGLEVLRRLKSDERCKTVPVVVLTSSQEDQDIQECYKLGVNSYVVKPGEFDAFAKTVVDLGLYWLLVNKPA